MHRLILATAVIGAALTATASANAGYYDSGKRCFPYRMANGKTVYTCGTQQSRMMPNQIKHCAMRLNPATRRYESLCN